MENYVIVLSYYKFPKTFVLKKFFLLYCNIFKCAYEHRILFLMGIATRNLIRHSRGNTILGNQWSRESTYIPCVVILKLGI